MKKLIPFVLLLMAVSLVMASSKAKHKKKHAKAKTQAEYTGPLFKIQDPAAADPAHAGFVINGHYQFTVVETVTPSVRIHGASQPTVHICVEGTDYKNQPGRCIEELHNGYGNLTWDAYASPKCYLTAYKADGTPIHIKKELLKSKSKPSAWKGNEITWDDGDYKVRVTVAKCKVEENHVCICPK